MAALPLRNRKKGKGAQSDLARFPVLVAAFLIALFGLLPGTPRNSEVAASARPIDDRSERSPTLSKRDPIRAVTIAERKDGPGGHFTGDDGFLPPVSFTLAVEHYLAAQALDYRSISVDGRSRPGALPRAPPASA